MAINGAARRTALVLIPVDLGGEGGRHDDTASRSIAIGLEARMARRAADSPDLFPLSSGRGRRVRTCQVGGSGNGGPLSRGLDVPGTDKHSDYLHAIHKLPDTDHVRCSAARRGFDGPVVLPRKTLGRNEG